MMRPKLRSEQWEKNIYVVVARVQLLNMRTVCALCYASATVHKKITFITLSLVY